MRFSLFNKIMKISQLARENLCSYCKMNQGFRNVIRQYLRVVNLFIVEVHENFIASHYFNFIIVIQSENPSLGCQNHKWNFYTLTRHLSLTRSKSEELHVKNLIITLEKSLCCLLIAGQDPVTSSGNFDQFRSMKLLWVQVLLTIVVALIANAKGV